MLLTFNWQHISQTIVIINSTDKIFAKKILIVICFQLGWEYTHIIFLGLCMAPYLGPNITENIWCTCMACTLYYNY